jgi:hypothetical protein
MARPTPFRRAVALREVGEASASAAPDRDLHRDLHLVTLGECDGVELCFSIMDILQYYSLVHLRPRLSI